MKTLLPIIFASIMSDPIANNPVEEKEDSPVPLLPDPQTPAFHRISAITNMNGRSQLQNAQWFFGLTSQERREEFARWKINHHVTSSDIVSIMFIWTARLDELEN